MRSSNALQKRLRALRNVYGVEAERSKRALLAQLRTIPLRTAAAILELHEDLLFLCAFPGAKATRTLARRLLGETGPRLSRLPRAQRALADDSGIADSITRHTYPFSVARWLVRAVPAAVEIDWRTLDDPGRLDGFVGLVSCGAEREAFESGEYATRDWIRLVRRADARTDMQWLLEAASGAPALAERCADEWDDAEVPVQWELRDSRWSVTHNALPSATVAVRSGMRRPPADVAAHVAQPLAAIERLPRARAQRVVASARAALAARCREVNAMSYPNLDEVWWCELGEGVTLAVIGIARELRLTLETNTGYMLFANGIPIGYGGVTPLFRQANTGINIFDAFRGGEASFLWAQMLRAFHTLYGSRRFVVNAYQFGAGNAEAIRSGAFWFYYRLGFRPALAATRRLAAREAQRMTGDRKYHSDARTLKMLATGDLHLDLEGFDPADHFDEALLPRVGAVAARRLATESAWSRSEGQRRIAGAVATQLGIDDLARWPAAQRRGFALLAPVVASLGDIGKWPPGDRAALASLMRRKGAPQERAFALAAQQAPRFHHALAEALRDTD
jgi:hypothetical protein